jgi:drug/metabolite transporter (DMT)-like permease
MDSLKAGVSETPIASSRPSGLLNPYLHLALNGLLVTAAELLLKRGAIATTQTASSPWLDSLGVATLGSGWVWVGIACYIVSFVNWLHILRWVPLSIAFPLASIVHVLIPLGSWLFLGETVGPGRWCGIALIVAGIWCIAAPLTRAEEAL